MGDIKTRVWGSGPKIMAEMSYSMLTVNVPWKTHR